MSIIKSTVRGLFPIEKTRIQMTNTVLPPESQTLSVTQLLQYLLTITPSAPVTLTLPPVDDFTKNYLLNEVLVADAVEFVIRNTGTTIVTMAIPIGSGGSSGVVTVSPSQYRRFFIRIDSASSYTLLDAGAAQGIASSTLAVWQVASDPVTANPSIQLDTTVPGVTYEDDFVFGSSSTDDTGDADNDVRMTFRKNGAAIGAFRAGSATGTQWNTANSGSLSVAFGLDNVASGLRACVSGGRNNTAAAQDSFVGGGTDNSILSTQSSIGGGDSNTITATGTNNSIGGGNGNSISGGGVGGAFVGGGLNNSATAGNATILGGSGNTASAIGGFVGGGVTNTVSGSNGAIGGGTGNTAGVGGFVGGGTGNEASGANSVVMGGSNNTASAANTAIPGGSGNSASGVGSVVCGEDASDAGFDNCFVFNDGVGNTVPTANQQVVWNCAGGFRIDNGAAGGTLNTITNTGSTSAPTTQTTSWSYTPGDTADWTNPDPNNLTDAIDRLAAAIGPVA